MHSLSKHSWKTARKRYLCAPAIGSRRCCARKRARRSAGGRRLLGMVVAMERVWRWSEPSADCFPLKVVQSPLVRNPSVEPLAAAMETAPLEYVRGAENVVVAVHVGMPFRYASTEPFVPAVVVAKAPEPLPKGMALAAMFAHPVPPLPTPSVPVTSEARLMRADATAPAVALRKPEKLPIASEPKNPCVEDA